MVKPDNKTHTGNGTKAYLTPAEKIRYRKRDLTPVVNPHDLVPSALPGKHIVITSAAEQSEELAQLLRSRGAKPLFYPCVAIAPPEDTCLLDAALQAASRGKFDWLVLPNVNSVNTLINRVTALGLKPQAFSRLRVVALGAATARAALQWLDLTIRVIPHGRDLAALVAVINPQNGTRILLPQRDTAPATLAEMLVERDAQVLPVTAYRTVSGTGGDPLPALLAAAEVDAMTFTSPAAVRNFVWRLVEEGGQTQSLRDVGIACLGNLTQHTAQQCGLCFQLLPPVYLLADLIPSLENYFATRGSRC